MIILNTNAALKATFDRLLLAMKEPVEWNGQFVVIGDYLILHGRVRSLFFNFESKKLLTNIIDIPVKEEEIVEIGDHTKVQNVLNLALYAFGKWGLIRGVTVEQDYARLNTLFHDVLREFWVEPGYSSDNFRFYKGGIRISYEDVVQLAIEAADHEAEEPESEEAAEAAGLWHKLLWKERRDVFTKTGTTFDERQKERLGNNFYMVGYLCPKCREHLHMAVFPEGKEFRIETPEGGVLLARAYTCDKCRRYYTPKPRKLLEEGDVYLMDFEGDGKAYEDYLELLGARADRVSNYGYNEYEDPKKRQAARQEEAGDSDGEEPGEGEQAGLKTGTEAEGCPAGGVRPAESSANAETGRQASSEIRPGRALREAAVIEKQEKSGEKEISSHAGDFMGAGGSDARRIAETAGTRSEAPQIPSGAAGTQSGAPQILSGAAGTQSGVTKIQAGAEAVHKQAQPARTGAGVSPEPNPAEESRVAVGAGIPVQRRESAKKRYTAKCNVLDRLSYAQVSELKRDLMQDKNLYESEKEPFLRLIADKEEQKKREHIQKLAEGCKGESYAKIRRVIEEIEKTDVDREEKDELLKPLYEERRRQADAEVAALAQKMPKQMDLKEYRQYVERIKSYPEADLAPYESMLEEKKKQAEGVEIANMIRHSRTGDRPGLTDLMERLKKQEFLPETLAPYMEKLSEKLRAIDEQAIAEICGNPGQMTVGETMEAYRKIEEGEFLPELKTNALEMLKKRLAKLKTDECELLVKKLKDSLEGRINKNDRHHFYPAKRVLAKEADPREYEVIQYALDTFGTTRGLFEYPIFAVDTSRDRSGKEGLILTPEHLFYKTMLNAYAISVGDIRKVSGQTGFLHSGLFLELADGAKIKIPYAVEKKELVAWGNCLEEFIHYLQEKPDSRNLSYLAKETHERICCFRCGYSYKGGNVCPKCGYKMNQ